MGTAYRYRCEECGYEHEYSTGGDFLSTEYFEETERLEDKLKQEILNGKHGIFLKKVFEIDSEDEPLVCECGTELFQCRSCHAVMVHPRKRIWQDSVDREYSFNIEFQQKCPKCKEGWLHRAKENEYLLCPSCKKAPFILTEITYWD